MGVCSCSMFCCMLLYVHSSIAIILMGKRELVALLNLSSWCLVMVERLFLAVPWGCLRFVIVVFPDHTRLLFCKIQLILVLAAHILKVWVQIKAQIKIYTSSVPGCITKGNLLEAPKSHVFALILCLTWKIDLRWKHNSFCWVNYVLAH